MRIPRGAQEGESEREHRKTFLWSNGIQGLPTIAKEEEEKEEGENRDSKKRGMERDRKKNISERKVSARTPRKGKEDDQARGRGEGVGYAKGGGAFFSYHFEFIKEKKRSGPGKKSCARS